MSPSRSKLLAAVSVSAAAFLALPMAGPSGATSASRGAATGDTYKAEATASALRVSIFGQGITIGSATADADSSTKATAAGTGALVVTQSFGASQASATKVGDASGSDTPTCGPITLPTAVPLLDLSSACSSAKAAVTASGPASSASGKSLEISLSGDPALSAIPIDTLTSQITTTLIGALPPLVGVFPIPPQVIVDQLSQLLNKAITDNGVKLLTIEGGNADASTSADGDSVDATTKADGATIKLLDRSGIGQQPILKVEIGESTTTVSRNRNTGVTTAGETAIPVRVTIAPDVAALLQLPQSSFEAPEGQKVDLPLPAPLTSSITLSGGSTSDIKDGKSAQSGSVDLNLLSGVNGGIQVGLSTGSSAVAGTAAPAVHDTVVTTAPPVAAAPTTLPRTGVEERNLWNVAIILGLGALGLGALVVSAARRSRIAKG
jgi:hypothetical protein